MFRFNSWRLTAVGATTLALLAIAVVPALARDGAS